MRLSHNVAAMVAANAIYRNSASLNASLEKLSTGSRINHASDDAAGLSISESLQTQVRGLAQAKRNASQGMALLQVAESSAAELSNILQRMRELAVQNANSTLTDTERGYTDAEYQALLTEIDRISNSAKFNGTALLDGSYSATFHIGANATAGTDTMTATIDKLTSAADSLNVTGTDIDTSGEATTQLGVLDTAIGSVSEARANIGALINRIEHAVINISNQQVSMSAAESSIRDVDFAYETTKFTRAQIMSQVGASMLAQANASAAGILPLFS